MGGTLAVCLTVAHVDLGAADVLLDYAEGLLVLRPALTPAEQVTAARRVLEAAGVEQAGHGVTCPCGAPVTMPGCDEHTLRRHKVRGLAATGAAGLIVAGVFGLGSAAPAAAVDPFETASWHAVVDELGLECTYAADTAECTSRALGPVHVTVERDAPLADLEYTLDNAGDDLYLCRFHTTAQRDAWVAQHPDDAEAVAELGALHAPIAMLGHTGPMS